MAQFVETERRQVFVDRDALWRDYAAFTPRTGKDILSTYRPTYGMAE